MRNFIAQSRLLLCLGITFGLSSCTPAPNTAVQKPLPPTSLSTEDYTSSKTTPPTRDKEDKIPLEQRVLMLEGRVQFLESQMESARPVFNKVDVMGRHFSDLSRDLESKRDPTNLPLYSVPTKKTWVEGAKSPVVNKNSSSNHKTSNKNSIIKTQSSEAAALSKPKLIKAAVTTVRVGSQKNGATRIVLDTTQPSALHYDLDNGEKILVIDLPKNNWEADARKEIKSPPAMPLLVSSYQASEDQGGAHLVLKLKEAAKVTATARLNPTGRYGHRVYIDIMPALSAVKENKLNAQEKTDLKTKE